MTFMKPPNLVYAQGRKNSYKAQNIKALVLLTQLQRRHLV